MKVKRDRFGRKEEEKFGKKQHSKIKNTKTYLMVGMRFPEKKCKLHPYLGNRSPNKLRGLCGPGGGGA